MTGKWPRHYAREIAAMTSREQRQQAIEQVPEELRQMVMQHVVNTFAIRKQRRQG